METLKVDGADELDAVTPVIITAVGASDSAPGGRIAAKARRVAGGARALAGFLLDILKLISRGDLRTLRWRFKWISTLRRRRRVVNEIINRHGLSVQSGPFAGMVCLPWSVGSELGPKLLGCYEAELHAAIDSLLRNQYEKVLNVGCGEGYYAVGLALHQPHARIHAFDIDPTARQLCEIMARQNGVVDRVVVAGACDHEGLRRLIGGRTFLFCDCEGYELDLLRPDLAPELANIDMLVELHDFLNERITPTIVSRFAATHDITLIDDAKRNPSDYPAIQDFSPREQRIAVDECRPFRQQWALMVSKKKEESFNSELKEASI